ncbi:hypothetical protein VTK26DRAFT_6045 [Humicola hyalothermophila]
MAPIRTTMSSIAPVQRVPVQHHHADAPATAMDMDVEMAEASHNEPIDVEMEDACQPCQPSSPASPPEPMDVDVGDPPQPPAAAAAAAASILPEPMDLDDDLPQAETTTTTAAAAAAATANAVDPIADWVDLTGQIAYQLGGDPEATPAAGSLAEMASQFGAALAPRCHHNKSKPPRAAQVTTVSVQSGSRTVGVTISLPQDGSVSIAVSERHLETVSK